MFFKNLKVYELAGFSMSAAALDEMLAKRPLTELAAIASYGIGWVPAHPDGALVFGAGTSLLAACGIETKVLPSSVVNKAVAKRCADVESRMGFKPGKKQTREIKEAVMLELLPRAFSKSRVVRCWIWPGWLAVDTSSAPVADHVIALLRDTLGELQAVPWADRIEADLTRWVQLSSAPQRFSLDQDCVMKSKGDDPAAIRFAHHGLEGDDVRRHVKDGKSVTKLGLTWNDRISFVLDANRGITRVRFLAIGEDAQPTQDAVEKFDAEFALMSGELQQMLSDLRAGIGITAAAAPSEPWRTPVGDDEPDPLYDQAVEIVRDEDKASVSFVQRRLTIGYNRAARLVERMQAEGVVGPMGAGGQCAVLPPKS